MAPRSRGSGAGAFPTVPGVNRPVGSQSPSLGLAPVAFRWAVCYKCRGDRNQRPLTEVRFMHLPAPAHRLILTGASCSLRRLTAQLPPPRAVYRSDLVT
jgi:hypothetical protein